jgi:hypothetical protein
MQISHYFFLNPINSKWAENIRNYTVEKLINSSAVNFLIIF